MIPLGGSVPIRVGLRDRDHRSEHCPQWSLERFSWESGDPSVARVKYSAPVLTITGLTVGEIFVSLLDGSELVALIRVAVVEPQAQNPASTSSMGILRRYSPSSLFSPEESPASA